MGVATTTPDSSYTPTNLPKDGETADASDVTNDLQGLADRFNAHIHDLAVTDPAAYVPTWTGSSSNPAIGNGTISGRYYQIGNLVYFTFYLSCGSTTTYGSGNYSYSLPVTAASNSVNYIITAWVYDSGTAYRIGAGRITAGGTTFKVYIDSATAETGPSVPMTWVSGDGLEVSGCYEVA